MMDVIIPVGDMPVTAQVTTPGKAIVAAQVSAAGYEQAMQAADRADAAASNADASAAKADAAAQSVAASAAKADAAASNADASAAKADAAAQSVAASAAKADAAASNADASAAKADAAASNADASAAKADAAASNADASAAKADAAASNADASAAKADAAAQSVAGRTRNDITPLVRDGTLSEAIRANDLAARGLKVGDYFTGKSGYTYHLADMDTFYGGYNNYAVVAQHHAGIVVDTHTDDKWNDAADTSNGYVSSKLHSLLVNTHLPVIRSDIADLTGDDAADHLIAHSKYYSTKVQNGVSSSGAWSSGQYISALTEMQVYGGTVWSSSSYDTGEAFRQLGVFAKFDPNLLFGNDAVWLRDVCSATHAADLNNKGVADYYTTIYQLRVAGLILFH